ncbi:NAD(P)H-binding protein [Conexibacter woesei]|uniref:NAD(P)H-binding protein n=1 Tax=Conexibacter woesei TaxID=191495 RepID=UPI0003FA63E0|nr:NAD(P)H-binding protein [Conexibacter woesei]
MSLVITGASGQLGRRAADLLLEQHDPSDVVLLTRNPDGLADFAARGADVRRADFGDPASLPAAFAGATRVLLISTDVVGERVEGHSAAIDAAVAAGASLIAYTSIPNPAPSNPAAVVPDHAATEQALRDSGAGWTFLRNALYSEYRIPEFQGAAASGTFAYNSGDGASAYVSREDCAAAAVAVLLGGDEHAGKAYDITGAESFTGAQLAELYASVSGRPVAAAPVDDAAFVAGLEAHGIPAPAAQLIASFGRAIREGQLNQVSTAVQDLTGRAPVALRDVLAAA